ncbi:MAG: hypothetical protein Q9M12_03645 [Mariprofundus sp.]|nr:hypothetical protein [Mariprofundus sp.]
MRHIKCIILLSSLLMSGSAIAADVMQADVSANEVIHEQQVQQQLTQLQQARDAAFLKQLEAEAKLMELQSATGPTTSTVPAVP